MSYVTWITEEQRLDSVPELDVACLAFAPPLYAIACAYVTESSFFILVTDSAKNEESEQNDYQK